MSVGATLCSGIHGEGLGVSSLFWLHGVFRGGNGGWRYQYLSIPHLCAVGDAYSKHLSTCGILVCSAVSGNSSTRCLFNKAGGRHHPFDGPCSAGNFGRKLELS